MVTVYALSTLHATTGSLLQTLEAVRDRKAQEAYEAYQKIAGAKRMKQTGSSAGVSEEDHSKRWAEAHGKRESAVSQPSPEVDARSRGLPTPAREDVSPSWWQTWSLLVDLPAVWLPLGESSWGPSGGPSSEPPYDGTGSGGPVAEPSIDGADSGPTSEPPKTRRCRPTRE